MKELLVMLMIVASLGTIVASFLVGAAYGRDMEQSAMRLIMSEYAAGKVALAEVVSKVQARIFKF